MQMIVKAESPRAPRAIPSVFGGILGVALLGLTAACGEQGSGAAAQQAAPPPPKVTVAKPVVRDIVEDDEFVGRFEALDEVDLRARVGGYLEKVHFTDGAIVAKGDLLFTIDQRPYKAAVGEAEANLKIARSQVEYTKKQLERARELSTRGNISVSALDERQQEYVAALAQVQGAKAALDSAKLDLEYTEIRAPIAGRIDRNLISVGNLVVPDDTTLTTIVAIDPINFYFDIDERSFLAYARDARARGVALQEGAGALPVKVRLSDARDGTFEGTLDFAENKVDQDTGTMRVRAVFDNPALVLQPGLFGIINIPGSLPYRGVMVPDSAITADQDKRLVYVVDEAGKVSRQEIRPGPRLHGYRVVREGLTGEETIVVEGLMRVRPGATVTPEFKELPQVAAVK
ncbi:efflux RND transporter periplasmic adaptor subunit [Pelagibius marinus]|uniref:efflux RND transporter periplasmic adaptor subunit n=1 Tax=Pelagibius marinus TaxID=2762760 RepID=UPI001D03A4E5|nr:efflux RND transporter periplasmic adaptor subunit [Pelagibius marinus]